MLLPHPGSHPFPLSSRNTLAGTQAASPEDELEDPLKGYAAQGLARNYISSAALAAHQIVRLWALLARPRVVFVVYHDSKAALARFFCLRTIQVGGWLHVWRPHTGMEHLQRALAGRLREACRARATPRMPARMPRPPHAIFVLCSVLPHSVEFCPDEAHRAHAHRLARAPPQLGARLRMMDDFFTPGHPWFFGVGIIYCGPATGLALCVGTAPVLADATPEHLRKLPARVRAAFPSARAVALAGRLPGRVLASGGALAPVVVDGVAGTVFTVAEAGEP